MNKFTSVALVFIACAIGIYIELQDSSYTILDLLASICFFSAGVIAARFRIWNP